MNLLEAKKYVDEYDDLENSKILADEEIKKLEIDLKFTKTARDGFSLGSGSYVFKNAQVILIRRGIKYWKTFIIDADTRRKELINKFVDSPLTIKSIFKKS